ncbi:putative isomerase YddE [Roseimaritima multifibrata]|uniref:Putative isomerase YddE n=1 Tax=Roseimaritima multifibrata TaxID=1930274 RepID=A0A517MID1_9BACT|nr:PhzF family phenazine biosynthesis protein [Roseimaritima multifibrata]QDS94635.1 putative isomerase YddE [Roseimaritima multifibrata]
MSIPIWQIDAFADRPFTGNPAAICILENYPSDGWLQMVAAEMNLSETSFIVPAGEPNSYHLRWFTPTTEVDLCGHATLAASHILIEQGRADVNEPIRFQTLSGELSCTRSGSQITLDFPATQEQQDVDASIAQSLNAALGTGDANVKMLQTKFDLAVIYEEADTVENLRPDFNALQQIQTRGVMVTAPSQRPDIDFVSRFFAPRCGINEDPVTGSAHCFLAPFWASRLSKTSLVGHQASPRGGTVHCQLAGDRVKLSGKAVTVTEGHLLVEPK